MFSDFCNPPWFRLSTTIIFDHLAMWCLLSGTPVSFQKEEHEDSQKDQELNVISCM